MRIVMVIGPFGAIRWAFTAGDTVPENSVGPGEAAFLLDVVDVQVQHNHQRNYTVTTTDRPV